MANDGSFEIHGTYDEDRDTFLDADGNEAFDLADEHGIAHVASFTLRVSDERLLKVWKAMGAAENLERDIDETSVSVRMHMHGIECEPEDGMHPRYGMVSASARSVTFEATDKHSPVTVATRGISLAEIEDHLLAAGLIAEADRRSEPEAAAPGPR